MYIHAVLSLVFDRVAPRAHHCPVGLYAGRLGVCVLGVNRYDDVISSLVPIMSTRHLLLVLYTHTHTHKDRSVVKK